MMPPGARGGMPGMGGMGMPGMPGGLSPQTVEQRLANLERTVLAMTQMLQEIQSDMPRNPGRGAGPGGPRGIPPGDGGRNSTPPGPGGAPTPPPPERERQPEREPSPE